MFTTSIDETAVVIRPTRGHALARIAETWRYRELLLFFVWRDVKLRYKQTILGATWVVVQPLLTVGVFSLFFGRLARIPSDNVPYPLFYFAGLLPWTYFSSSLQNATAIVVEQQRVITKVYFPRVILPIAAVLSGLVDVVVCLPVLAVLIGIYGGPPSPMLIFIPLLLAFAAVTALAVGLWLAALNAMFRDVRYVVPFLTQVWLFASPVAYPASLVPAKWRWLYGLNPMTGVIEGFRWAVTGQGDAPGRLMLISAAAVGLLLTAGWAYFQHVEGTLADVI